MKLKCAALALLLPACHMQWWDGVADYTKHPHQDEGVTLIWNYYKASQFSPPLIGWINYGDCYNGRGFVDGDHVCVEGDFYVQPDNTILLESDDVLSDTPLAHELGHAANYVLTGDPDANHRSPYFANCGLGWQANQLLVEQGW